MKKVLSVALVFIMLDIIKNEVNKTPKPEFFLSWGFNYTNFVVKQDKKKSYAEEKEDLQIILMRI